MHPSLNLDEATVARFCETHHIRRLALFGSQLKGTARPDSDTDLLVEFDPAHTPSLFGVAAMEIRHMIEACESALAFAQGRARADLDIDKMLQFACVGAGDPDRR